jgi:hypothetical protein
MRQYIQRFAWPISLALVACIAALFIAMITTNAPGQAAAMPRAASTAASEVWRFGVTSEGDASYQAVIGRLVSASASFRSNRAVSDIYYLFPAAAQARTVQSAALNINSRAGTYTGSATIALEVRSYDGTLQRTLSTTAVDAQAAATGTWIDVPLVADPGAVIVSPNEYLAFHFALDSGAGGSLDVRPIFEVVVE